MPKGNEISVVGRRWDSSSPRKLCCLEGQSLERIVLTSIKEVYRDHNYSAKQCRLLLKYARCRVNGIEISREEWKSVHPKAGAFIEILHGVRGGGGGCGGGKNPVATILSAVVVVVATAVTWWAGGAGGAAALAAMGMSQAGFCAAVGLATMGALMAINALFPAPQPSLDVGGIGNNGFARDSQTYSLTGGRNSANVGGYVPLVLGKHHMTPPLGGRSWTVWEGNEQFFHTRRCRFHQGLRKEPS